MLRGVATQATNRAQTSTDDSGWTPYGRSLGSSTQNGTTTGIVTEGILGFDCAAEAHQRIPWGSQYLNVVPREGRA